MAHFHKFKMSAVGRLFLHNNRTADDGVTHSNEEIDIKRTIYNYHLKKGSITDLNNRLDEVFSMGRRDGVVLGEWIVTKPKDVKEGDEAEREFFLAVYDFFAKEYGEENIISAVVHKDESNTHLHLDFTPIIKGDVEFTTRGKKLLEEWKKEKGVDTVTERLCCKDLITRVHLKSVHPRLSEFVTNRIGYEVEILNGATEGGNKTILALKNEKLEGEIEKKEKEKVDLQEDVKIIYQFAKANGLPQQDYGLIPLLSKIDTLKKRNEVLSNIIKRARLEYSREDIAKLRSLSSVTSQSSPLNIIDETLLTDMTENDAIILVDVRDKNPREYYPCIAKDFELKRAADSLLRVSNSNTLVKNARMTERTYCLYKADTAEQAIANLLELRQQLLADEKNRQRKVYMQLSELDDFYFAKNFLESLPNESRLYTSTTLPISEAEQELQQEVEK